MIDLLTIILLIFGVLQIILFFKVWIMTDDIKKLKNELVGNSDEWTFRKAALKGDKNLVSKLLFNEMFLEIKKCYIESTLPAGDDKEQEFVDKMSSIKEKYSNKYSKYGIEFPEAVNNIKTTEDIEKL